MSKASKLLKVEASGATLSDRITEMRCKAQPFSREGLDFRHGMQLFCLKLTMSVHSLLRLSTTFKIQINHTVCKCRKSAWVSRDCFKPPCSTAGHGHRQKWPSWTSQHQAYSCVYTNPQMVLICASVWKKQNNHQSTQENQKCTRYLQGDLPGFCSMAMSLSVCLVSETINEIPYQAAKSCVRPYPPTATSSAAIEMPAAQPSTRSTWEGAAGLWHN